MKSLLAVISISLALFTVNSCSSCNTDTPADNLSVPPANESIENALSDACDPVPAPGNPAGSCSGKKAHGKVNFRVNPSMLKLNSGLMKDRRVPSTLKKNEPSGTQQAETVESRPEK